MSVSVTLKMTAQQFDELREVVTTAADTAQVLWEEATKGEDQALVNRWYDRGKMAQKLLETVLK